MRGHIRKRGKDSWTIVLSLGSDPASGKRLQKWFSIKGTKKDAEKALAEHIHSIEQGTYVQPQRLTVGQWLIQWLESYVALHRSPGTAENYVSIIHRHLIPELGALRLAELRPQHLQSYYALALEAGRSDGHGGLSPASVLHHHRVISLALRHAVKQGLLARNVAQSCDPPHPTTHRMATLTADDVPRLLEASRDTLYHDLLYAAIYTGLRRGELLGLRWCDVDLDLACLSVVQTLERFGGKNIIKEPKSRRSRRQVSLPPSLALLLREHRVHQAAQRDLLGKTLGDGDLVFAHPDGAPLEPSTVTHEFARLLQKAGLPHVRFHDLRHTHATLMLKAGIHPKIVSERLGHASVALTLDVYSHVAPGLQEAAAKSFDRMLVPTGDPFGAEPAANGLERDGATGKASSPGDVSKTLAAAPRSDSNRPHCEAAATLPPSLGEY